MDIRKYNNESKLIEIMNKKEKEHQNETENDSNKMIDNNTTNEDDSIYTIDEVISYCSSPKSGLVSIKKTKTNKDTFLSIGSEISNITNTITFKIAMIKKEISFTEINDKEIVFLSLPDFDKTSKCVLYNYKDDSIKQIDFYFDF